jgi:hypothetical protein
VVEPARPARPLADRPRHPAVRVVRPAVGEHPIPVEQVVGRAAAVDFLGPLPQVVGLEGVGGGVRVGDLGQLLVVVPFQRGGLVVRQA